MKTEVERVLPAVGPDSTLYVADEKLRVVYANEEWRRFAEQNKGDAVVGPGSKNRLLDSMSGKTKKRWEAIYQLLLDGRLPHYEEDYICSSPQEQRIYRLRITPAAKEGGDGTWLVHHTVRIDDNAEEREEMRRRVRALDSDPAQVQHEYRRRVLGRPVAVSGFKVAQHLEPLGEVGGDVLWHRAYGEGTDLVVADVMGHGDEAGLHAAKMVMMLDTLAADHREPQDILASLNRGMIRHRPPHETAYATGIHFRFGGDASRLLCANFGHAGPLFSRSGQVDLKVGLPLGMVDTVPVWPATELDLSEHGTRFLVFSDGITEQFDGDGTMYGTERLLEIFRGSLELDLEVMLQRILEDLTAFRGDAVVKDDRTLLALELLA